jgi:hypothetical protein
MPSYPMTPVRVAWGASRVPCRLVVQDALVSPNLPLMEKPMPTYTPRGDTIGTATRLRAIREGLRELARVRELADELAGAVLDHLEANSGRPVVRAQLATALTVVLLSHTPPPP